MQNSKISTDIQHTIDKGDEFLQHSVDELYLKLDHILNHKKFKELIDNDSKIKFQNKK